METQREKRKEREGEEGGEQVEGQGVEQGKSKRARKDAVEVVHADGSRPAEAQAAAGDANADESGKPKRVRLRKSQFTVSSEQAVTWDSFLC